MARGAGALASALAALLAAATALAQSEIALTDQSGRSLRLEGPAQRVVTIPMPASPLWVAVDQSATRLVGHHRQSRAAVASGSLGDLFPRLFDVPTDVVGEGFQPNVEEILRVGPDLVFQWGDRGDALIAPLEAVGLTVAALRYGGEAEVRAWMRLMAAAAGKPARADALIDWRERIIARLAPLGALPDADKPRVLYLLRALEGFQAAGSGTFNDYSIRLAGGRNAAASLDGFRPVNAEQILAWAPDVVLLNSFEPGLSAAAITDHPLLGLTPAARQDRVFAMPIGGYRWDPPSQESPLAWLWLAQRLHPDHPAAQADLAAEIGDAYALLYGQASTPAMIAQVLGPR